MITFLLRVLLAGVIALVTGAVSLWLLGTAWWSVAIAVLSAVASFFWSLCTHRPEVSRG